MRFFLTSLLIFGLLACDSLDDRPIDSLKMAQAIRDRKPQRITPQNLMEWVRRKGNQWCFLAQKDLYRQIKRGLADSTLKHIQDFATLPALPVLDSIAQIYLVDIQLHNFRKATTLASQAQKMVANYADGQASREPKVEESSDKQNIYYCAPIVVDNTTIGAWLITFPVKSARSRYDYKDLR